MAGYWTCDGDGGAEHLMYTRPFVVRGVVKGEGVSIASFETRALAEDFVAKGAGHWGADVTIENWNE